MTTIPPPKAIVTNLPPPKTILVDLGNGVVRLSRSGAQVIYMTTMTPATGGGEDHYIPAESTTVYLAKKDIENLREALRQIVEE